jgi:hypothetical protein
VQRTGRDVLHRRVDVRRQRRRIEQRLQQRGVVVEQRIQQRKR